MMGFYQIRHSLYSASSIIFVILFCFYSSQLLVDKWNGHETVELTNNTVVKKEFEMAGRLSKEEAENIVKSCNIKPITNISDFFSYPKKEMFTCHSKIRMGGKMPGTFIDGDKWLCLDEAVKLKPNNCIVYSFGIANEWSFDDAMALYGCQVWSFDHTLKGLKDHKRGERIQYLSLGIAPTDSVKVKKLSTIKEMLGHKEKQLDYLKLDVEGSEVPVLEQILSQEPQLLSSVTQLGMEIHPLKYTGKDVTDPKNIYNRIWRIFGLLNCLEFKLFSWQLNPYPKIAYTWNGTRQSGCYEVVFMRLHKNT